MGVLSENNPMALTTEAEAETVLPVQRRAGRIGPVLLIALGVIFTAAWIATLGCELAFACERSAVGLVDWIT